MGDTGSFITADGAEIAIDDTQTKLGDLFVHLGRVTKGKLNVGDAVEMRVDGERRVTRCAPIIRPPICCMRRCAAGSALM